MKTISTNAAALKAVLCYIDPENTPKIAYDRDDLAIPLINHLKECLGDKDGSQTVFLSFTEEQSDLEYQFTKIVENISSIMETLSMAIK